MGLRMSSKQISTLNQESKFDIAELFFSRTDKKGRILSGNEIFRRVSQFSWEELLQKPHNIIRHPDMPKAVFYLLWQYLQKNLPIGAYVKNRAKDGSYYWVYALAMPIDDFYLSIRLKPTSELLPAVEAIYARRKIEEQQKNLSPEESAKLLLQEIQNAGFLSYEAFMATTLLKEFQLRQLSLNQSTQGENRATYIMNNLTKLIEGSASVSEKAEKIFNAYFKNRYVATNLQILSEKGNNSSSMAVVASQFQALATEIQNQLKIVAKSVESMRATILSNQFLLSATCLQDEMIRLFSLEASNKNNNSGGDAKLLSNISNLYKKQVEGSIQEALTVLNKQVSILEELQSMVNGLEVVRINGKVESSRFDADEANYNEVLKELQLFISFIRESLSSIQSTNQSIGETLRNIEHHVI